MSCGCGHDPEDYTCPELHRACTYMHAMLQFGDEARDLRIQVEKQERMIRETTDLVAALVLMLGGEIRISDAMLLHPYLVEVHRDPALPLRTLRVRMVARSGGEN